MIPPDGDEPVFAEPWQAQAFAMVVKLHDRGVFTWKEWTDVLATEIRTSDGEYYEQWLSALEKLVEWKEITSRAERNARIAEWDKAARATPHGQPIELNRVRPDQETSRGASRTFPGPRR